MPLVLHPDAYLERKLVLPNGDEIKVPAPKVADFRRENIEIIEEVGPSMLVDERLCLGLQPSSAEKGDPTFLSLVALRLNRIFGRSLISQT